MEATDACVTGRAEDLHVYGQLYLSHAPVQGTRYTNTGVSFFFNTGVFYEGRASVFMTRMPEWSVCTSPCTQGVHLSVHLGTYLGGAWG